MAFNLIDTTGVTSRSDIAFIPPATMSGVFALFLAGAGVLPATAAKGEAQTTNNRLSDTAQRGEMITLPTYTDKSAIFDAASFMVLREEYEPSDLTLYWLGKIPTPAVDFATDSSYRPQLGGYGRNSQGAAIFPASSSVLRASAQFGGTTVSASIASYTAGQFLDRDLLLCMRVKGGASGGIWLNDLTLNKSASNPNTGARGPGANNEVLHAGSAEVGVNMVPGKAYSELKFLAACKAYQSDADMLANAAFIRGLTGDTNGDLGAY